MDKIKHLILPLLATVITIIGSGISTTKANNFLTFYFFSQDKILHLSCYFVLQLLWSYGLNKITKWPLLMSLVITIGVGILMEVCQYLFFEGRLFEFLDIILFYISMGCRVLRLDAVAFLWKKMGTNCLHLPETHEVIKLIRHFVEVVAPETILLTETNVPHEENVSYFGLLVCIQFVLDIRNGPDPR